MGISSDVMPKMGSRIDGKHGIYELGDELGHRCEFIDDSTYGTD